MRNALDAFLRRAAPAAAGVFHLWPEHVPALRLWNDLGTQWRVGMAGPIGLDYTAAEAYCRVEGIRGSQRRERFAELRAMERAALRAWAAERERAGPPR